VKKKEAKEMMIEKKFEFGKEAGISANLQNGNRTWMGAEY